MEKNENNTQDKSCLNFEIFYNLYILEQNISDIFKFSIMETIIRYAHPIISIIKMYSYVFLHFLHFFNHANYTFERVSSNYENL